MTRAVPRACSPEQALRAMDLTDECLDTVWAVYADLVVPLILDDIQRERALHVEPDPESREPPNDQADP